MTESIRKEKNSGTSEILDTNNYKRNLILASFKTGDNKKKLKRPNNK